MRYWNHSNDKKEMSKKAARRWLNRNAYQIASGEKKGKGSRPVSKSFLRRAQLCQKILAA